MDAIGIILGGGQGTRLQPLTKYRSKPAVPVAGKYRLVDIPMSNCINSHIRRIFLLTQFNSVSLHDHVTETYRFDVFHRNFIRILAAQQTPGSDLWYQGTADAVRQNLRYFSEQNTELAVILAGDQLYRLDFQDVVKLHNQSKADITICTKPVDREEASALGIMQISQDQRITAFKEKPGPTADIKDFAAPNCKEERYLASMGIYIFNMKILKEILESNLESDFGKHIIPASINQYNVYSYIFDGYWKDLGTVRSFWEANLELAEPEPEFTFYDANAPIYTHMRFLPASKINCCTLNRCLLSDGCMVSGHRIYHSLIGLRQTIGEGSVVEDSITMGADYYDRAETPKDKIPLGIGKNCYIKNAIIDKNARIGNDVYISPEGKKDGTETNLYKVDEGIIVIAKNAEIPHGMRL